MYEINIVENPFNNKEPAWLDDQGRVGVRIKGENSVRWYLPIDENNYLLDEVTMIVSESFNN